MLHTASGGTFGTAEEHREYAIQLDSVSNQIADYIASRTGLGMAELKPLMAVDRYIDATQAETFGFLKKRVSNNILALSNMNIKPLLNAAKVALKGAFGGKAFNMEIELEDGNAIWVETEDGELAGKKAYTSATGEPLPDGTYKIRDGREITVKGGTVDGVSEDTEEAGEMEDMEALKAKVAELEAENMKLKGAQNEAEANLKEAETAVQNLSLQVQHFAKLTSKAVNIPAGVQNLGTSKTVAMLSEAEQLKAIEARRSRM